MADMLLGQTEEWFTRNQHEIIRCPYQPGNLIISKYGCRKRRDRARRETFDDLTKGDVFEYIYKSGLMVCRDCRLALKGSSKGVHVIPFHRQDFGVMDGVGRVQGARA